MPSITTPIEVGRFHLDNRLVLAPLTRLRNSPLPDAAPPKYTATYYAQRTNKGGLIISEATAIHPEAYGIASSPGIWSDVQITAWKRVTDAIHEKGGVAFCQLWAMGRVSDPKVVDRVVGPSEDEYDGNKVAEMSEKDIDRFVGFYVEAAKNALKAGFDGVEIHGANGYLLDQFTQSVSNHRTDEYGGSLENRFRFPLRVLNAVAEAVGPDRTGYRISPWSSFQGMREEHPLETFEPFTKELLKNQPKLAYIHVIEPRVSGDGTKDKNSKDEDSSLPIRKIVDTSDVTKYIAAGGIDPRDADEIINKYGGLLAFGRYYIANPDLLERIVKKEPLNDYDRSTFYTPGVVGYTDYPTFEEEQEEKKEGKGDKESKSDEKEKK